MRIRSLQLNQLVLLFVTATASVSCASSGTATGVLESPADVPEAAVTLVWKSEAADPSRGTIDGTLPNGMQYHGHYYEVVEEAASEIYEDAWDGWEPYWADWSVPWYDGSVDGIGWPEFVRI